MRLKSRVLYYPGFNPDPAWLRGVLLLYDEVYRIIPEDVDYEPPWVIKELIRLYPEDLKEIHPKKETIELSRENLKRLEKAFEQISQSRQDQKEILVRITENGGFQIANVTWLHSSKVTEDILSLLKKYGLIELDVAKLLDDYIPWKMREEFIPVNETASNLILTYIANKISKRYGLPALTDLELEFVFSSLEALKVSRIDPNSMLATSTIRILIPLEVLGNIDLRRYEKIRDKYSELRVLFIRTLKEISEIYRLEYIEDREVLEKEVREITQSLDEELQKIKDSLGVNMRKWIPFSIGSLLNLIGTTTQNIAIITTSTLFSFALQVVDKVRSESKWENEFSRTMKMLARLNRDLTVDRSLERLIRNLI